jgi:hypothetical protein
MAARKDGDVVLASVNMWAVLADNDPGDSTYGVAEAGDAQPVEAAASGSLGDKKRRKKKKQAKVAAAEPAADDCEVSAALPNGKVQSSIGDVQKRRDKRTKAAAADVPSVPSGHGPTTNGRKGPSSKKDATKAGGNNNRYQPDESAASGRCSWRP